MSLVIRPRLASDSMDALTALLHRAYARLGAMGLNYTAVDQSAEMTARRLADAHGLVAERDAALVGTVVVQGAFDVERTPGVRGCPWYLRRDVAHLHQLGVEPAAQGQGVGAALIEACEQWARERGYRAIALDTAAPAAHLRALYARLGYLDVDEVQWAGKTYRTVIMVKPLAAAAPTAGDGEHRVALVRALWAHVQARDWAAMRAAFDERAVLHWPASGERFEGAQALVRVNAEYPEGWSLRQHEAEALVDGRIRAVVEVTHGEARFFCNGCYRFEGPRIVNAVEHWATAEAPPAWRTRERLGAGYHRERA